MISFSPSAKLEILKTLNSLPSSSALFFRVGMKGTSCSGSLLIGLDRKNEDDEIHILDEIPVIISRKHLMYIVGTHISFEESNSSGVFKAVLT